MTEQYGNLLAELVADTSIAVNTDYLASDFQAKRADSVCRITIVPQTAGTFRLVPNTGTGFSLNADVNLPANGHFVEDVALDPGRTWNIQNDTGTIVVSHLRVQELSLVT